MTDLFETFEAGYQAGKAAQLEDDCPDVGMSFPKPILTCYHEWLRKGKTLAPCYIAAMQKAEKYHGIAEVLAERLDGNTKTILSDAGILARNRSQTKTFRIEELEAVVRKVSDRLEAGSLDEWSVKALVSLLKEAHNE